MAFKKPWLQPAAGVGDLEGVAEAPLAGTVELFAALEGERDRRASLSTTRAPKPAILLMTSYEVTTQRLTKMTGRS